MCIFFFLFVFAGGFLLSRVSKCCFRFLRFSILFSFVAVSHVVSVRCSRPQWHPFLVFWSQNLPQKAMPCVFFARKSTEGLGRCFFSELPARPAGPEAFEIDPSGWPEIMAAVSGAVWLLDVFLAFFRGFLNIRTGATAFWGHDFFLQTRAEWEAVAPASNWKPTGKK